MTSRAKRALIVLTSVGAFPASTGAQAGRKTGFYMDEMATPYWALRDAGVSVEFASIKGGEPPADPGSIGEAGRRKTAVQRFLDDAEAMAALRSSAAIATVDPDIHDLLFLPGGHGVMWDFRQSEDLARVAGRMFERGCVVGAVCHGPAGLIEAATADGAPILRGRRANAFTDAEEAAVGLADAVPFLLESAMREKGALFEGTENFGSHAVRDDNLVTGQNPASVPAVASLLLEALREANPKAA
ncbi:MAG: type 1 glutamine amidotransferase domain-containing protein [Pikeienuella sp.]